MKTPLEPAHAVVALEDADDREQIFEVLLRAARSKAKFAALLSVHADHLRGRKPPEIEALKLPRTVPAFEAAIASQTPSVGAITTGEPFVDGMIEQLGGATPTALVLPIAIGNRTVALIVAHRGTSSFALADVGDLLPLATAASPALARVLAARSKAAASSKPVRADTGYDVEVIVQDASKQRARLAELRAAHNYEELADSIRELIREGLEKGDPDEDEQLDLLVELGHVEAERLGRIDRAIEAWKSAQTIDAGDPRVLDAMQALYIQQGQWVECADLIEKRVALADDPAARIAQLLELAAIAHERLDDDERAIAAYERILNWEPAHEVATRELEHLYSGRQQWEPLAALLLDRASREEDGAAAVTALEAVAQMYEDKVGDLRAAFLVWLAVYRRDPDRERLIEQLERLGPAGDAWDESIAEGRALAEELEATHPAAAARVWTLVGRWTRDHAANLDEAAQALVRAFHLQPDRETLGELIAVLRGEARWGELAGLLSQRAQAETDLQRRSELYAELGDLHESQLGDPAEAISWYEKARADEPEARPVLAALHRLYRQTGAWDQLAQLMPQLIQAHDVIDERGRVLELHCELGSVLADHLGRSEDAVGAYQAALALEGKHAPAYQGIARVYQATGQTEALLDASEAEVDAADRPDQIRRYPEIAAAWAERGRFDRGAACWQKAIALEPGNVAAHRGLAQALRGTEQWGSLTVALRALLELVREPAERLAIQVELGNVLASQLDDVDGAVAAYQAALGIDGEHRGALDALARLYERNNQAASGLVMLQRLLDKTTEPRPRADLFQRVGHAYLGARDLANARLHFVQAIGLDLNNSAAHEGLARVHLQDDELVAGGEELIRAAELAATAQDKIRCFADAAWVFRHRLHDNERARQCLQLILELEPEHADAKQALAELLHHTEQWETLWPHLEQEVQRAKADAAMTPTDRCEIYTRAARCALELDKFGAALELYEMACSVNPSPAMQIERAEAMFRAKSLEASAAAFQTIVLRHAQALERPHLASVYRRLAEIHTTLGKTSQAQLFHQKVLEIDPKHRPTLKDLAELHLTRGRIDEAIASFRGLLDGAEPRERSALLERVGDLYRDRVKNAPRAMSTYVEALEADPANRRVLQRLLDLQSEAGNWKAAVETIGKFLDHETDPARRAAYHLAAAEIRRTELRDKPGALAAYELALDELFREQPLQAATRTRALDTFRIIDELVTSDKNWKHQEQSYRRMIKRVPAGDPVLMHLWDALGEVYRSRLKHYQSAIEAFEIAHSLDPDKSTKRAGILAELYGMIGKARPEVTQREVSQRASKLVESDPFNPDAYRALGRSALEAGRIDEAWCAARALVFLKKANADEAALYKKFQPQEVRKAGAAIDEDTWKLVRHPDEDPVISAIFALIWEGPVAMRAGPAKAFELKPKERIPVEDGTRVIAKIFRHAARVLAVAIPDVYAQPHRSGRLLLANIIDRGRLVPAVIVGRDLMTGYRDTEIAASIGALLAVLRPAYYLKLTLPTSDELEAVLGAAAQLVGRPGVGRPQLEALRTQFAGELQGRITRDAAVTLQSLVARLPELPDLSRWRAAVDMAAQRAGLLVCGELAAAARMLSTEGGPRSRVQDLVAYSVSPAYFAVRRQLGVAVA